MVAQELQKQGKPYTQSIFKNQPLLMKLMS